MKNNCFVNKVTLMLCVLIIAMGSVSAVAVDTTTLVLENKDSNWNVISDDISAVVEFNNGGQTFDYTLNAQGLLPNTEYSLIYYADYSDRVNNWGGDNPGALVGTGTSDESGNLNLDEEADLGFDLPSEPDANIDEYDYCESDGYTHCHGAKLWLVPSSDYDAVAKKVINWNPSNFLFETDMITYDFFDEESPVITDVTNQPISPTDTDDVEFCATVTDESALFVLLRFNNGVDPEFRLIMNETAESGRYCRAFSAGTTNAEDGMVVTYSVNANDEYGNNATSGPYTYTYDGADPVADFECTSTQGDENLKVTCTSTSTDTVDLSLDYVWTFVGSDTPSSTSTEETVTYENDGVYTVTLTVTDDAGHSDTKTYYIEVLDVNPVADFSAEPSNGDEPLNVQFTDLSTSHDDLISRAWDFGDGETSSETDPLHTYQNSNVEGYEVSLTVCDVDVDCSTVTQTVYVNNLPPTVEAGEYTCNEGETITLTATATDVPADYPLTYNWNLDGDEEYETEGQQSVSYTCGNGDDEVSVEAQVTDNDEDSGYDSALIVVNNVAPSADANGPYQSVVNEEVCFAGTATDVVDTEFSYQWDLDYDGEFSSNEGSCTSYSEPGTYTVALVVNDGDDDSEVATATITVYEYGIQLSEGQNLISIPLVPQDTSVEAVLNGVNPEVVWAYKHNPETGENQWYFYSGEAGDLDEMIPGYGYYVIMSEEDTLYNNGDKYYQLGNGIPLPPQVTLTPGWNLVGHYGLNDVVKEEETQDLSGGSLTDLAEVTLLNEDAVPVSDWDSLMSGEGYWAFITGPNNLLYAPSEADYTELN